MSYYWEPAKPPKKSNGTRIIAVIIILMVVVSTGLVFVTQIGPSSTAPDTKVRVAVLDSGIDVDYGLQGRVVAQASFVTIDNGFDLEDVSTTDSRPQDTPHGTIIAKQLATFPNVEIVNGKVMGDEGSATTLAVVDAIEWAIEQNCSVINLSLGGTPTLGDPIESVIEWAFDQGVVIIASAGNTGEEGVLGTTIESPALYDYVLAVGALMEDDTPAYFSSIGPTLDRYMKPDITAPGYTTIDGTRYYGTSFSAPRVAGSAAVLIGHSIDNNITYTPGSIMTALMLGADPMDAYPEYVVGAGKLNVDQSMSIIQNNAEEGNLPEICFAFPGELPIDFEKLFASDTYTFNVRIFSPGLDNFTTSVVSATPSAFVLPSEFEIDQVGQVQIVIDVPESGVTEIDGTITFASTDFGECSLHISFEVGTAVARIAFDIAHTPWDIDSIFGQFREFYKILVENDVSVTEIRDSSTITNSSLHAYEAIVILDPCAYSANETDPENISAYSIPFSENEKQAYQDYYNSGGGIFVVGLSNSTLDVSSLNEFLDWTGFSLTALEVPSGDLPDLVTRIDPHIITSGINGFHYLGATINIPLDGHRLARYGGMSVMGYKEGAAGGKLVVTGSNFMLDNYGLLGLYSGANDNALLGLRIVLWCSGHLV